MKKFILKSVLLSIVSMFCFITFASAQVGPVLSVSQNQSSLPPTVNNFLSNYYPGGTPTNIQLLTLQNAYQVTLNSGTVLTFDQNSGRWLQIVAQPNFSVSQVVVFNLMPGAIYDFISRNQLTYNINSLFFSPNQGYTVNSVDGNSFYFDLNGIQINDFPQ